MQRLERTHLVQFFLFQAQTLELDRTTAIIAPNGAGKSALLDALQIVLLGGDGRVIRFNAQAGGSHRSRTIRDYCLGVYRSGEDGRVRDTAATYISLVFRDEDSGHALTAGIALGAAANEPDHRLYGLYLLPGVALELDDHFERLGDDTLPLEWTTFRELAAKRCKAAGDKPEFHSSPERFLKDLLLRLRPDTTSFLDAAAYRKAFLNALNLQRVDDVDLFVRTLVAEERPTEIARFRALLEGFRLIKEKIEHVAARIAQAEVVAEHYRKLSVQAVRGASSLALAAEYERDLHGEKIDAAERALATARALHRERALHLAQARSERDTAKGEHEHAQTRLQGLRGYNEQASFDELAARDRADLAQLKKELLQQSGYVRDLLQRIGKLGLPGIDAALLGNATAPWQTLYAHIAALQGDAELALAPQTVHAQTLHAVEALAPIISAVNAHARTRLDALDAARQRTLTARRNQERLAAGQAELRADVMRLMSYLRDEGIEAKPVCDLVRVADPAWQPVIEAYLGKHVEALLIPVEHEERATRLYRSLQGGRAVYGVKLALTSHARAARDDAPAGSVAALIESGDVAALAYLRSQLGDLRCVETEGEVVRTKRGLTRDGLLAKGGGIERLRPLAANELKIGASDSRERRRLLHEEMETADREARELETQWKAADDCAKGLTRIGTADEASQAMHALVLRHREAEGRFRSLKQGLGENTDPDLLRLTEQATALATQARDFEKLVETLIGETAKTESKVSDAQAALAVLNEQEQAIARRATEAFAHPDVDPNQVEELRRELDAKFDALAERLSACRVRAAQCERRLNELLPEAWRGLAQYGTDHGLAIELEAQDWRAACALLARELDHLKGTELVQYQQEADAAYATAVQTFRANVASALFDNFTRLKQQINTLNRTLKKSPAFSNNERYQFRFDVLPELRELHRFIQFAAEIGETDTLFGNAGEVPQAFRDIIEDRVAARGAAPSPLDDYRRFFEFEVDIKQDERVVGTLSERMRSGSGGEHRAPLYVIAGAALAAAYDKSEAHQGGIGLILLDEFGDKIDAQNARATTDYLRSLGLQLVLAAPDTAQGTLTGVLDSYIELFRDGDLIQLERIEVKTAGHELLDSDQFASHPELLEGEIARIKAEAAPT